MPCAGNVPRESTKVVEFRAGETGSLLGGYGPEAHSLRQPLRRCGGWRRHFIAWDSVNLPAAKAHRIDGQYCYDDRNR
jgi:hypothetical protein